MAEEEAQLALPAGVAAELARIKLERDRLDQDAREAQITIEGLQSTNEQLKAEIAELRTTQGRSKSSRDVFGHRRRLSSFVEASASSEAASVRSYGSRCGREQR